MLVGFKDAVRLTVETGDFFGTGHQEMPALCRVLRMRMGTANVKEKILGSLIYLMAKRPVPQPYPGWRLGVGESGKEWLFRIRRRLWSSMNTPHVAPWSDRLVIYLYPGNETSRAILLTGYYEPNEFYLLSKILASGMAFVDVGANMGLYTLFASKKVGERGVVVSIEPSNREFQRLKATVEMNALTNVRLLKVAVSNRRMEAELLVATEEKSGHNTLGAFGYDSVMPQGKEQVRVERLDDIVQQEGLQRVDVIKMDIEGAEFFALQGAANTLTRYHPIVLLELADRTLKHQGCSSTQVWEFLTQRGYRIYAFDNHTGLPVPVQRRSYFDSENIIAVHESSGGLRI